MQLHGSIYITVKTEIPTIFNSNFQRQFPSALGNTRNSNHLHTFQLFIHANKTTHHWSPQHSFSWRCNICYCYLVSNCLAGHSCYDKTANTFMSHSRQHYWNHCGSVNFIFAATCGLHRCLWLLRCTCFQVPPIHTCY